MMIAKRKRVWHTLRKAYDKEKTMCGRFALAEIPELLARILGLAAPKIRPRYNIAPTQAATVVVNDAESGGVAFQDLVWGLTPFWAKDTSMAARCINARAETVHEKPAFRAAYRHRRCLVPATGFYEWRREGRTKTPFYFFPADPAAPLALAGVWEDWTDGVEHRRSFSIITTAANGTMRPVHDRMPVILPESSWPRWLDPEAQNPRRLADMLAPCPDAFLECRQVGPFVNNARNEGAACIEPA